MDIYMWLLKSTGIVNFIYEKNLNTVIRVNSFQEIFVDFHTD
jgi:hypothetical protein